MTLQTLKRNTRILMTLSLLGGLISSYLIYLHFSPDASTICQLGEKFDCDVVNKSQYAEFLGIPVAILGTFYYVAITLFGGVFSFTKKLDSMDMPDLFKGITLITGIGVAFTLYLTYAEAFILDAYCIFCLAQQVIILIMFGLLIHTLRATKNVSK